MLRTPAPNVVWRRMKCIFSVLLVFTSFYNKKKWFKSTHEIKFPWQRKDREMANLLLKHSHFWLPWFLNGACITNALRYLNSSTKSTLALPGDQLAKGAVVLDHTTPFHNLEKPSSPWTAVAGSLSFLIFMKIPALRSFQCEGSICYRVRFLLLKVMIYHDTETIVEESIMLSQVDSFNYIWNNLRILRSLKLNAERLKIRIGMKVNEYP